MKMVTSCTLTLTYFLSIFSASFHSSRGFVSPNFCSPKCIILKGSSGDDLPESQRRGTVRKISSAAIFSAISVFTSTIRPALGAEAPDASKDLTDYLSVQDKFFVSVPTAYKVIVNKIKPDAPASGKLFSALDLKSGTAITVYRENACPIDLYASQPKLCDVALPSGSDADGALLSEQTVQKDATRMLRRYDDRDNAVLGGASTLESVERMSDGGIFMIANTVLPTGGAYRDEMGITRESTITRVVRARVALQTDGSGARSLLGVWVNSPEDEWRKPAAGIALRRVVESMRVEGGQL
mmetsp:Transcript_3868/g.8133  ORF Transcript_3868/g.8133 Transcript_3868/m.8133 type:complete len:297 (-) Transcript_3868:342-1232(-)